MSDSWETAVAENWAPEACAYEVVRNLRENSLSVEVAQLYYSRLKDLSRGQVLPRSARSGEPRAERHRSMAVGRASAVLARLQEILTPDEMRLL